jgi:hypothetical protein
VLVAVDADAGRLAATDHGDAVTAERLKPSTETAYPPPARIAPALGSVYDSRQWDSPEAAGAAECQNTIPAGVRSGCWFCR